MANIRVSYALASSLVVAVSAATAGMVVNANEIAVSARPQQNIQVSAFVVPMEYLEEQTVTVSDFRQFSFGKGVVDPTDSVEPTEQIAFAPDIVLTDSVTIYDVVYKDVTEVVDYDRNDADVDPDPVTIADTSVFAQNKTTTDTVTASDSVVRSYTKVLTDSATAVDSVSILLIPGVTTPLYDVAFASDEKFTYQWTLGTINSHLVHQPLVNGEFVLTTNPNAGIVYTIRTESVEYTYNGYGLNENQLN